ncbi:retrovirus-related Pol polyprotein from transposon 297-like Protein [Elysia marginata]|uniref:Retrovirus-related Pol polyprotein from transposon 297-like Protein n=1 Tax=Elysia marginata TaxID=1093978 RepID=A0AAV4JBG1_9GAST|nr:retrovirus-related Pol polyprotein from transposon 297-like Protein [Elysia marginata]
MLAIVFAAERFSNYIYGREVEVQSDHKPLETITKKSLHKATPKLQTMMMRFMRYNLQVKYTPGSQMYIADTLSRAYISDQNKEANKNEETVLRIMSATVCLPATKERLKEIQQESQTDEALKKIRHYIENGWPSHKGTTEPQVQPFWNLRHYLHVENGIVFYENRMVIPESMRKDILQKLHSSHLGVDKCKARARESIFWPGLTKDIEMHVSKCAICAKFRSSNRKEPMISHAIPDRPWAKLGADIFHFGGHDYLLIVDYFSKFPEIARLSNKTTSGVIQFFVQYWQDMRLPMR